MDNIHIDDVFAKKSSEEKITKDVKNEKEREEEQIAWERVRTAGYEE